MSSQNYTDKIPDFTYKEYRNEKQYKCLNCDDNYRKGYIDGQQKMLEIYTKMQEIKIQPVIMNGGIIL